jgi:drug/metabolite transporter (DMT)-like permease
MASESLNSASRNRSSTMPPPLHRSMTPVEWTLLVLLSTLWGASFLFVAVQVTELSPVTIVTLRVIISSLLLALVLVVMGVRVPRDRLSWRDFVIMGLLNNVAPFTLIAYGQSHIASALASILNATAPLFTVVVAHLMTTDEKMTPARIAGVLVGFAGVVVMIGPSALADIGGELLPQLACLTAALGYASSAVFARRFSRRGIPPMAIATGQMTTASLVMLPFWLVIEQPWTMSLPSGAVIAAVLALAVLSTVVAYILYYRILATAGSVNLMLVTFLIPVTGILLGALVLGEHLEPRHFLGMAAIGVGLACIDGRLVRHLGRLTSAGQSG